MYCEQCGKKLEKGAVFCSNCGTKVNKEEIKEETKQEPKEEIIETKEEQEESNEIVKENNKKEEDSVLTEENKEIKEEAKEDVKQNTTSKEVKNKKSKKPLIITLISIAGAVILFVLGYFLYQFIDLSSPIKEDWGQKYYTYLKSAEEDKNIDIKLPEDLKNSKIGFYEIKGLNEPIMIITYEKQNNNYMNIYYIKDDEVKVIDFNNPTSIQFLYNIEEDNYDYYTYTLNNNNETYKKIIDEINGNSKDYTFNDEEKDSVIDVNGNEIYILKMDKTFIKLNTQNNTLDYNNDLKIKELKNLIIDTIKQYEPQDKLVNDDIKNKVEEEKKIVNSKIEEIKKAEEEVEKKKEEELKKGYQVGNATLAYGTYKFDVSDFKDLGFKEDDEVLILNVDKTCHYTRKSNVGQPIDTDCTFESDDILNSFEFQKGISLYDKDGNLIYGFMVYQNNSLSDQWHGLKFQN